MSIEQRLATLERQNRRLRKCGLVLLVLVGASILMGQAPPAPAPKVIEAQRFVLKDAEGNQRGVFGILEDGNTWLKMTRGKFELRMFVSEKGATLGMTRPETAFFVRCSGDRCEMQFWDDPGNPRLRLGLHERRPYVVGCDPDGRPRATMVVEENGDPWFLLRDKNGNVRSESGVSEGQPKLILRDAMKRKRLSLRLGKSGWPSIRLNDEKERSRATMFVEENGDPWFLLRDKNGNVRSESGVSQGTAMLILRDAMKRKRLSLAVYKDFPFLVLRDKNKAKRLTLRLFEDGAPSVQLADEREKEVWAAPPSKDE